MMDTGGPAFPQIRTLPCGSHEECEGLTLRDYFAARAMPALLELWHKDLSAIEGSDFYGLNLVDNETGTPDAIAEEAYAIADAMLAARG